MTGNQSGIDWQAGDVPVSRRFDDPYFALGGGLDETRHVFLAGNDLPARLRPGFHVAELGVGTGLNLLALAALAGEAGQGPIRYTGFEAFPMSRAEQARALAPFEALARPTEQLCAAWPEGAVSWRARIGRVDAEVIVGDARATLPDWPGRADAWFLDGFAPAKNPEMWGEALMKAVARKTAPGGTFATYTAAGHVRRALAHAGFSVERCPGFGRKRHMSRGVLGGQESP